MIRAPSKESQRLRSISLEEIGTSALLSFRIDPEQTEDFSELVDSIRRHGLIQPLVVRRVNRNNGERGHFQLISGYRRFCACKQLEFPTVPCIVRSLTDQEAFEIALVENVQRRNLNPIEEAEAFKSYVVNFGRGSVSRLARKIGKSEEYVSHRLLLLGLPKVLIDRISRRLLNPSLATELVWLKNENQQLEICNEISKHSLSHREVRSITRLVKTGGVPITSAVQHVMTKRQDRVLRGDRYSKEEEKFGLEQENYSWQAYSANTSHEKQLQDQREILEHSVLILRTCLAGLDTLIGQAQDSPSLSSILMRERNNVHTILDQLVSALSDFKRGRSLISLSLTK